MSTVAAVLARLRIRLDETSANEWDDSSQLIPYLAEAEQWLADRLGRLVGSGRFRYRESFALPASTETYALSSLTKRFAEVIEAQHLWSDVYIPLPPLQDGMDARLRSLSTTVPASATPHYALFGDTLKFLPIASGERTIVLLYRYLPTIKTASGESLETPQDWDHLLVLRAAHFANSDAGQANLSFEDEYASLIAEMEDREAGRTFGSQSETVHATAARSLFC